MRTARLGRSWPAERNQIGEMERVAGIEPAYSAWKAAALPLSYTRAGRTYLAAVRENVETSVTSGCSILARGGDLPLTRDRAPADQDGLLKR